MIDTDTPWMPYFPVNQIACCDALELLRALPSNSIHCIVTSPPYWRLRDYQIGGQIGLEDTMQAYLARLVEVFHELRRVLRNDGVFWCNIGDSYAANRGYQVVDNKHIDVGNNHGMEVPAGLKSKDLCGIPWRLAFALQDDGWYLRSDIIWHKLNPLPESVKDRPTKSHEYVFLFAKSEHYWYDQDAIREPHAEASLPRAMRGVSEENKWHHGAPGSTAHSISKPRQNVKLTGTGYGGDGSKLQGHSGYYAADGTLLLHPDGRNKRSVWSIATESSPYAHYATFPRKLIEPMILGGCPPKVCAECGAPWERITEKEFIPQPDVSIERVAYRSKMADENHWDGFPRGTTRIVDSTWQSTCDCHADTLPGIVLDPFMGSGTTGLVAMALSRRYMGSELNPVYAQIARERCRQPFEQHYLEPDNDVAELPLFAHLNGNGEK